MPARLSILMVTPEATPFAKTGGLADVAGALPLALGRLEHRVTLVLPRYRGAPDGPTAGNVTISLGADRLTARFVEHVMSDHVRAVLVDCPALFDREHLYGTGNDDYADNARRFAFLSRAALEVAVSTGLRPDVVHAHDWQTGLAPVYLKTAYATEPRLAGVPAVFTVHNLAYQGLFPRTWLDALSVGEELFTFDGLEYWGQVSFLKAGIAASEIITTVSRRYAMEIQTAEYGFGFEGILAARAGTLVGIPNGIDTVIWDPGNDRHLPQPFSAAELEGKAAAKQALLEATGLASDAGARARPLIGMVSRMVDQKGFDLLEAAAERVLELPVAVVLLGSGDPRYERQWRELARAHPDRVGVTIGFDDHLAHLITGGADLFLMPSRFEPCGLSQMYSLRYGTVPVVRSTGGLDDTVVEWNPATGRGTGFKFDAYTPEALLGAIERALALFADATRWRRVQVAGMRGDFSWERSAQQYVQVYHQAMQLVRGSGEATGDGRPSAG